jgi:hypothetical protein
MIVNDCDRLLWLTAGDCEWWLTKERAARTMSMRALVLVFGLLMIGEIDALAANAPLSVEPRGAAPREDLFVTKPRTVPPSAAPAAAAPAVPAAERVMTGNPLWAIPLSRLTATRERPLFAPTRMPPPVAAVVKPAPAPIAPPKPIEPETPQLSLLGTIAGREKVGLFIDSASKTVLRLKAGENHKGWVLRDVRPRQVELAKGLDSTILELPLPDMKAGVVTPPAMPAVAAASGAAPGIAASPSAAVYTAKAAGTAPLPTPPPGFGQPPVFRQQPAPTNPFQQGRTP